MNRAKTKRELVLDVWNQLGCASVGAQELELIQKAVREAFGAGAGESPASLARILADEGAPLRHPEVLDCDTRWREQNSFEPVFTASSFSSLTGAAQTIERLDTLRKQSEEIGDETGLVRLRELALKAKRELQVMVHSKAVAEKKRLEAQEVVQWLTLWLQSPGMFPDWLSLRLRSPEFYNSFGISTDCTDREQRAKSKEQRAKRKQ